MGMRINTAIGWGMPFDRFLRKLRLPGLTGHAQRSDGWYDLLEEALSDTKSMRGPRGYPLPITGAGDTVLDLITFVGYDDWSDVVLMPTIGDAKAWHRRDDDIDYAMHWGPRGRGDHDVPENRIEYLKHGFHPYGNERMDTQGNDVPKPPSDEYEAVDRWENDESLLPGLPPTLRHWVSQVGLLDKSGLAELRPIRAIWWA